MRHFSKLYIAIAFSFTLVATSAFGQERDARLKNWMQHPEIRAIRELYQEIEGGIDAGRYSHEEGRVLCQGEPIGASLFMDSAGTVRKYEVQRTMPNVMAEGSFYYDSVGLLRFSFQSLHARSGTHTELRTYYEESGQVLWANERLIEGPDESVQSLPPVWRPRESFESLCPDAEPRSDVRILDIQARLFCEQTADFTQDVIGDTVIALWNVTTGGGDAGCHSHSTLVLVVVQGPPGQYLGDVHVGTLAQSVPLEHSTPRDTLNIGETRLRRTNDDGQYFVPIWLYDTGCSTIEVHAWITGARETTERTETIPFMCGE